VIQGSNGNKFQCMVWPDSGADHCVFPLSFATALGLNPLAMKKQMTGGVGSSANVTYYDTLEIYLGGLRFSTLVGFTQGLEAQGIGLLGQLGFFENYQVLFDHRAKQFHIDAA